MSFSIFLQVTSLLADIGGQLGFWIGLSIIACVEIMELLIDLAAFACYKMVKFGRRDETTVTPTKSSHSTGKNMARLEQGQVNGSEEIGLRYAKTTAD